MLMIVAFVCHSRARIGKRIATTWVHAGHDCRARNFGSGPFAPLQGQAPPRARVTTMRAYINETDPLPGFEVVEHGDEIAQAAA
jgi:hypothetical protein